MRIHQTKTRELFIAIVRAQSQPMSLDEMYQLLRKQLPTLVFSTVYRLAKNLEAEGKLLRMDWRERGSRYEWAERLHHHHIVCTVCGRTADIDDSLVNFHQAGITEKTGFLFGEHHVELTGLCADCQRVGQVANREK